MNEVNKYINFFIKIKKKKVISCYRKLSCDSNEKSTLDAQSQSQSDFQSELPSRTTFFAARPPILLLSSSSSNRKEGNGKKEKEKV